MGTCYSKGSASSKHSKHKAPKVRGHNSKSNGESGDATQFREIEQRLISDGGSEGSDERGNPTIPTSIFPDLVSGLEDQPGDQMNGIGDKGVAPSDSGIESIGLIGQEETILPEETSSLSSKIQRLSRGSCHKCGNFRLEDNALTALLSNTYCLCGPRQAGKPSINPDCQTHGTKKNFKRSKSMPVQCVENSLDFQNSPGKSSLKKCDGEKKVKILRISLQGDLDQEMLVTESFTNTKAPLAQFDTSTDNVFDDSVSQKRLSRRSLLSEILDITDSICKCDFYSNEYCVQKNSSSNLSKEVTDGVSSVDYEGDVNDTLESLAFSGSSDSICEMQNERQVLESSSKKSASLSKFVTFARQGGVESGRDEVKEASGSQSCPISPMKTFSNSITIGLRNSLSEETSSGVDMQSADMSGSSLRDCCAVTKTEPLLSVSSCEAIDCTEDDMASLDMDSLSRVTSLSYSSIRQLLESTEDLVGPLDSVRRMTIDGEDCVIIPTHTYKQMQSDLTMLKEQLVCLSSLLQEETESRNKKCISFSSDLDVTPTQDTLSQCEEYNDDTL